MTRNSNVCSYGKHIGCPYADDASCRRCAERLTHAVNYMAVAANVTSAEVAGRGRSQSYALTNDNGNTCIRLAPSRCPP
ncbi:MAG TPA: hypothetical protein VEG65_05970 [Candidatus Bathyarchaeia archaeon]|nr:hypothetical protein [Candidatus Bathyarchaeia archaeon]